MVQIQAEYIILLYFYRYSKFGDDSLEITKKKNLQIVLLDSPISYFTITKHGMDRYKFKVVITI